jgi:CHASE2 domain-containing sensor protein
MERILKIAALAIALTALAVLSFFGLAIWVFIPLMPAAIIYAIAVTSARRTTALRARPSEEQRKAA